MNEFRFICARLTLYERVLKILSVTERHRIPAILESVLGKSSAIPVCLSESCMSHDVTRALIIDGLGLKLNLIFLKKVFSLFRITNFRRCLLNTPTIYLLI